MKDLSSHTPLQLKVWALTTGLPGESRTYIFKLQGRGYGGLWQKKQTEMEQRRHWGKQRWSCRSRQRSGLYEGCQAPTWSRSPLAQSSAAAFSSRVKHWSLPNLMLSIFVSNLPRPWTNSTPAPCTPGSSAIHPWHVPGPYSHPLCSRPALPGVEATGHPGLWAQEMRPVWTKALCQYKKHTAFQGQ